MAKKVKKEEPKVIFHALDADKAIESLLTSLYRLQKIESAIDKIQKIKGELPEQVGLLKDTIEGLNTRMGKLADQQNDCNDRLNDFKHSIVEHQAQIDKYQLQLNKIKNSREHDSIAKEIEFQQLEIELCEKRIKEVDRELESLQTTMQDTQERLEQKQEDLLHKQEDLQKIEKQTDELETKLRAKQDKEEADLNSVEKNQKYLLAFKKVRKASHNGLAVVTVDRDACGGCFNKVTRQRQMDIKMHKKILFCEYCGRFLVDESISEPVDQEFNAEYGNEELLK